MFSEIYYILRSSTDGRYLVAHPDAESSGYLLLFRENFDALSYLNTHAGQLANRFAVESVLATQLGNLLKRWGFSGVGIVIDPLLPKVDFMQHR
ncbi:hypothetical protein NWP22_02090 [Anabaenopsis tanganyikae CS-531]|jgi:hypothetical protein|uniref:Uncharacterized protein n=2 Tax=Anabaenopsis TaxID=110103 RepID=A0ABT5ASJ5_9CYAN|nr:MULTISPECIES: hypothetical protein [Nostocales]MDB9446517.1 hypothetical protein [Anabaena sp. CS-542/02]MDB9539406.1 hypothetical protein [Anabaenopsis arnoldii]MDH6091711.1 hypothetical protein [Anabaenopsis arnoldii]MDH6097475.1 hypothetical protein [Anabaenopsis sp. FSS-46]MDH6104679.1 hypothetical protein [Anabaenopsis tanganyikae CS-531]